MSNQIHSTAIISKETQLGDNIKIGPYSVIMGKVTIGDGCDIKHHVNIQGTTSIGKNCQIWHSASVGGDPQDLKYKGKDTKLTIGDNCIIRELVTIHRGTELGGFISSIGDNCFLMHGCHVAHDCQLGNNVIMAAFVHLGGHVTVGNHVTLGGFSLIIPHAMIGDYSMTGAATYLRMDLAPFVIATGAYKPNAWQINSVRLDRLDYSKEDIKIAADIFTIYFKQNFTSDQALAKIKQEYGSHHFGEVFLNFVTNSRLGILR
ncbi:MAG: acyl-ACP--UDP-N-acetylglucosamine O-acyltransferase [SAR324 cluster bacterium]|nr:acyl-ACP--UDP-N-acetylglucosamine O-acyltransferase [SAR324 cluster bacterium]